MAKEKNPFVNYTTEEIFASEAITYVVRVGPDLLIVNGRWAFNKRSAQSYCNKVIRELLYQLKNGNKKEREYAMKTLVAVQILPLRIH